MRKRTEVFFRKTVNGIILGYTYPWETNKLSEGFGEGYKIARKFGTICSDEGLTLKT